MASANDGGRRSVMGALVREVIRDDFLDPGVCATAMDIGRYTGMCGDFADSLYYAAQERGLSGVEIGGVAEFVGEDGKPTESATRDFPNLRPPPGLDWSDIVRFGMNDTAHCFVWLDGLCYDSDAIDGLDNPYDLCDLRVGTYRCLRREDPKRLQELIEGHSWWRETAAVYEETLTNERDWVESGRRAIADLGRLRDELRNGRQVRFIASETVVVNDRVFETTITDEQDAEWKVRTCLRYTPSGPSVSLDLPEFVIVNGERVKTLSNERLQAIKGALTGARPGEKASRFPVDMHPFVIEGVTEAVSEFLDRGDHEALTVWLGPLQDGFAEAMAQRGYAIELESDGRLVVRPRDCSSLPDLG